MHKNIATTLILAFVLAATPVAAQSLPDCERDYNSSFNAVHAGVLAVGVPALMISDIDVRIQDHVQASRSPITRGVAVVTEPFGRPLGYMPVVGGILLWGYGTGNECLIRTAAQATEAMIIAGVMVTAGKFIFGRKRPLHSADHRIFQPLRDGGEHFRSFPSGHATMAFALATALADETDNPWLRAGLYTVATGTALSRVHDNHHWASDVIAGAFVGYAGAKIANGAWDIISIPVERIFFDHRSVGISIPSPF